MIQPSDYKINWTRSSFNWTLVRKEHTPDLSPSPLPWLKGRSDLSKPSQVLLGSPGRETRWGCSDPLWRILLAALTALYPEAGQRQPVISGALALVVSCGGGNTRSTWVWEKQNNTLTCLASIRRGTTARVPLCVWSIASPSSLGQMFFSLLLCKGV